MKINTFKKIIAATLIEISFLIPSNVYASNITYESGSEQMKPKAEIMYEKLPENIKKSLERSGVIINFTGENLAKKYGWINGYLIYGIYTYNYTEPDSISARYNRKISLNNNIAGIGTMYHEIGHYIDEINEYPSNSDEFHEFYKYYAGAFSDYAMTNTKECFAEMYSKCINEPDFVKTLNPNIYTYITDIANNTK